MKRYFILAALVICFLGSNAFADTSIKAEVDKNSITTDEALTYKLTISSTEKTIPAPELPEFTGFNVVSQAKSVSFNFSAGSVRNSSIFTFVLAPVKTGELDIPPATIKINNQTYSTEPVKIEVKPGKRQPQPEQKKPLPVPTSSSPEETTL